MDRKIGSWFLTWEPVRIYHGLEFYTATRGQAINTHMIVNHGWMGIENHSVGAGRVAKLLNETSKRLKRKGEEFPYAYAHECGEKRGFHTHIIARIPINYREEFSEWLPQRYSAHWRMSPDNGNFFLSIKYSNTFKNRVHRQWKLFKYICKGIDPDLPFTPSVPWSVEKYGERPTVAKLLQINLVKPTGFVGCLKRAGLSVGLREQCTYLPNLIEPERYSSYWLRQQFDKLYDLDALLSFD